MEKFRFKQQYIDIEFEVELTKCADSTLTVVAAHTEGMEDNRPFIGVVVERAEDREEWRVNVSCVGQGRIIAEYNDTRDSLINALDAVRAAVKTYYHALKKML